MQTVTIHYTRIPDRLAVFRQHWVAREDGCTITLMDRTPLRAPVRAGSRTILEDGAPVVWFTWDEAWHDVGAFHDTEGRLTGWYANIITPVRFRSSLEWETTDLFLDVWLGVDGDLRVLDGDELDAAVSGGLLDEGMAARARAEAASLLRLARAGEWPAPVVGKWTLARARAATGTQPPHVV